MSSKTISPPERALALLAVFAIIAAVVITVYNTQADEPAYRRYDNYKARSVVTSNSYAFFVWEGTSQFLVDYIDADYPLVLDGETNKRYNGVPADAFLSGTTLFVTVKAYLGTSCWLYAINVANPSTSLGDAYMRSVNGTTQGVFVAGNYAYVATGSEGLAVIDISTPTNMPTPKYSNTSGDAQCVYVSGNYAYVADGDSGLAVIDVSSPTNPGTPIYKDTEGGAHAVVVAGSQAYVADGAKGLAIIDVSTPASPGAPIYVNCNGNVTDVYVDGTVAYAVIYNQKVVSIDVTTPASPGTPADFFSASSVRGVHVAQAKNNKYAYMPRDSAGMYILRARPSEPSAMPLIILAWAIAATLVVVGAVGSNILHKRNMKRQMELAKSTAEVQQKAAAEAQARAEVEARQQAEAAQRQAEAERQAREAKERQRLETLKTLVEMSEEILLDDLAGALELPRVELLKKIAEWGKQFGITLKGDRVVIARDDVSRFVARLDEEMKAWGRSEVEGQGKKV